MVRIERTVGEFVSNDDRVLIINLNTSFASRWNRELELSEVVTYYPNTTITAKE